MKRLWVLLLICLALGCATPDHAETVNPVQLVPDVNFITIVGNREFATAVPKWQREIRRRFKTEKIVMYFGHGGVSSSNGWVIRPDNIYRSERTAVFAAGLHKSFPGYIIVLITCNPTHEDLYIPDVYYARQDVWVDPDSDVTQHTLTPQEWAENITYTLTGVGKLTRETTVDSFLVGTIQEFTTQGRP